MLSYRHAFHAGNHADVLKHLILHQVLAYFASKDKPFWFIDTHAGAGLYALDRGYAAQNAEYASGIARLWDHDTLPEPLAQYVAAVRSFNPGGQLRFYPGSPCLARAVLGQAPPLRLFELHPTDFALLQKTFARDGRSTVTLQQDGFAGLKALLPPPPRRAVVLLDPPYEQKQDYARVVDALKESLKRFATGTYLLWYPDLQRPEVPLLKERLAQLGQSHWLHATLTVCAPRPGGMGMQGSGLFVINPPWTLPDVLRDIMPRLVSLLAQDEGAGFTLDSHIA